MALGKVPKIYIGWSVVIATGIGAFIWARNAVTNNRYIIMKTREKIQAEARAEQEKSRAEKEQLRAS